MTIFTESDAANYLGMTLPRYTALAVNRKVPRSISIHRIRQLVAEEFGVTDAQLVGAQRAKYISRPRQAVYWLAKRHTKLSLPVIGRHVGNRDHTTVIAGDLRCLKNMDNDPQYRSRVLMLDRRLAAPAPWPIDSGADICAGGGDDCPSVFVVDLNG